MRTMDKYICHIEDMIVHKCMTCGYIYIYICMYRYNYMFIMGIAATAAAAPDIINSLS